MPDASHIRPFRYVVPGHGEVAWFSAKRMIQLRSSRLMRRDLTSGARAGASALLRDPHLAERLPPLLGDPGIPVGGDASEHVTQKVISCYHDLWHVEQSFRMSKTDLAARPMFVPKRDAIEAHLTIVFTALHETELFQGVLAVL